jgi:hypothetical protein
MLSGRSSYKATAPAAPPMAMDAGKPSAREAMFAGGVALAFWGVAALGGWIAALFGPHQYETLGAIGIARGIGLAFGALVGLSGLWLGLDFARLTRRGWLDYQQRLADWHAVTIEAWEQQGGQIVEEQSNEWELRADKPDEVLWFLVAMHRAAVGGNEAPWALRRVCDEGVWVGNRKIAINTNQARLMVDNLATMGLITGRTERHPGRWVPATLDDAVTLYERNSKKVL